MDKCAEEHPVAQANIFGGKRMSFSWPRAVVAAIAAMSVTSSGWGQIIVWDNERGPFGTAGGHLTDPFRRSLLDDFEINSSVIVTDFNMPFVWQEGGLGRGQRVDLEIWSDANGEPKAPILAFELLVYEERWGGEFWNGRELLEMRQQVSPRQIESGLYWLDMHEVGEFGFQLMTVVGGEPGWVCYEDFPPCPRPGIEVFGLDTDFSFRLLGFIPGQANEGFIRIIEPLLFSGEPEGEVADIRESDDAYYTLTAGPGILVRRPSSAVVNFETTLPQMPLDRMDLRIESIGTAEGVQQAVALFDYVAQRWVLLDNQALPFEGDDLVVRVQDIENPLRFVNESDGQSRVRVVAYSQQPQAQPHQLKVDKVNFVMTYTP